MRRHSVGVEAMKPKFSIYHGGVKLYDCADEHDVAVCMTLLLKGGYRNVLVTRATTTVKHTLQAIGAGRSVTVVELNDSTLERENVRYAR